MIDPISTIELKKSILEDNDADAEKLRAELNARGVYYINLMSAPGSGKTSLLVKLIGALKDRCAVGVMEADIDGDVDAYTVREAGAEAIQLHTGGMCHLDADMSRQGFKEFCTSADVVFLENIGNLVCPAEFDTGVVVVTKTDTAKYFDFDLEKCKKYIAKINPNAKVFAVSSKTGEGVDTLADWIFDSYKKWREGLK